MARRAQRFYNCLEEARGIVRSTLFGPSPSAGEIGRREWEAAERGGRATFGRFGAHLAVFIGSTISASASFTDYQGRVD